MAVLVSHPPVRHIGGFTDIQDALAELAKCVLGPDFAFHPYVDVARRTTRAV